MGDRSADPPGDLDLSGVKSGCLCNEGVLERASCEKSVRTSEAVRDAMGNKITTVLPE